MFFEDYERRRRRTTGLTIHALKELGEIAETLIKKDRPGHWKNELGNLCGLCIKPMLELAETDFDTCLLYTSPSPRD